MPNMGPGEITLATLMVIVLPFVAVAALVMFLRDVQRNQRIIVDRVTSIEALLRERQS